MSKNTSNTAKVVSMPTPAAAPAVDPKVAALEAQLAALKAENEKLQKQATLSGGIKVSEKGAVSVYGLGKWPVTLYPEQWAKVFAKKSEIEAFIEANKAKLSFKKQEG